MGNFNREDKGGFRSGGRSGERDAVRQDGFQKKSWGGGDRGNKEQMMHQAVCSECGKRCEVPFRPVNGKPVYCNDCFARKRGQSASGDQGNRVPAKFHYESRDNRRDEGDNGTRRQLTEINMKLDRLIKAIETFTGTSADSVLREVPKKDLPAREQAGEKKSVDVPELKKAIDKATKETSEKTTVVPKKAAAAKKKK